MKKSHGKGDSSTMTPFPSDHPLMVAWSAYMATDSFANARRWALHDEHVDGSLWAAFMAGWETAHADNLTSKEWHDGAVKAEQELAGKKEIIKRITEAKSEYLK